VEVVDQEEFDAWFAKQKPQYLVAFPDKDPANKPAADSVKIAAAPATPAKTEAKM
jgi:cytochrome c oxidase subunit 2